MRVRVRARLLYAPTLKCDDQWLLSSYVAVAQARTVAVCRFDFCAVAFDVQLLFLRDAHLQTTASCARQGPRQSMTSRQVGAQREQILAERRSVVSPNAPQVRPLNAQIAAQADAYRAKKIAELPPAVTPAATLTPSSAARTPSATPAPSAAGVSVPRRTATIATPTAASVVPPIPELAAETPARDGPHVHSARAHEKQRTRQREQVKSLERQIEEERAARRALRHQLDEVVALSYKMVEAET